MSMTKLIAKLELGFLVLLAPALGQVDHAPLPESCIADYRLWSLGSKADVEKLPASVIQPRQIEMWRCASVVKSLDSEGAPYAIQMLLLSGTYSEHLNHRALDFITRHRLMTQFEEEDAAGQR